MCKGRGEDEKEYYGISPRWGGSLIDRVDRPLGVYLSSHSVPSIRYASNPSDSRSASKALYKSNQIYTLRWPLHIASSNQHGFLPNKGIKTCWLEIIDIIKTKRWVYEYDLESFFDSIDHDLITETLVSQLKVPKGHLSLWRRLMTIPVKDGQTITPTMSGMPQGTAIAPIICILTLEHIGF